MICEHSGGLLCARDAALAHPDNELSGPPSMRQLQWKMLANIFRPLGPQASSNGDSNFKMPIARDECAPKGSREPRSKLRGIHPKRFKAGVVDAGKKKTRSSNNGSQVTVASFRIWRGWLADALPPLAQVK